MSATSVDVVSPAETGSPPAGGPPPATPSPRPGLRLRRPGARAGTFAYGLALTVALTGFGLWGGGGLQLGRMTFTEVIVDAVAAFVAIIAILTARGPRLWGFAALAAFTAYVILTAASILWSVEPSESWLEANRALSWLAAFGAGLGLARSCGRWWSATLSAVVVSATIICGWALLTRIFPEALSADEIYARLREPYQYWNSVGLTAAMGIVASVWLGARRSGHSAISALAYPAAALLTIAMMLAYSRGSLLALVLGLAVWLIVVPLRLRSAAVLIVGVGGGLLVTWWAFSQETLTTDRVAAADRATSGLELGIATVAIMLLALLAGLMIRFSSDRRRLRPIARRRIGALLLIGLVLMPVAAVAKVATSERGLSGTVHDAWASLTDPRDQSAVRNDPSRLTKVGSVRAKYWEEAIKIYRDRPLLGAGAGAYSVARKQYRSGTLTVRHAHGFVVQTAADLGTIGLAIIALLTIAWLAAADRTIGVGRGAAALVRARGPGTGRSPAPIWDAERVGLAAMVAVVVVFSLSSFVDWTWYVPGNAIVAMVCAGWVAGRGPLTAPASDPSTLLARARTGLRVPLRAGAATFTLLLAAAAIWTAWQPLASSNHAADAQEAARPDAEATRKALALADKAISENPLSIEPLLAKAYVEMVAGRPVDARRSLVDAVRLQPANPDSWIQLADFTLHRLNDPELAVGLLKPALHLDPHSPQATVIYLEATRKVAAERQQEAEQREREKANRKAAAREGGG